MENATNFDFQGLWDKIIELATTYGIKLLLAIVVLVIGLMIVRSLTKGLVRIMKKAGVSESLIPFLRSLASVGLKILVFISVLGMVGVQMTSFIAVLGAAGLAVGLALQGTLQNFAGGVIILLFKPYKVGDYIDTQGYAGTVKEIQIFTTVLNTPDNKTIIIPNSPIATGSLINYSAQTTRRVDFSFGIGYGDDIEKARKILLSIVDRHAKVKKDPAPFVRVSELADSSVNFAVRVWVEAGDYWDVFFDVTEQVKKDFDKEGVSIPYPQTDVHVYNHK
ncbi:MAG: mechanosensitive ion channel domain-containing protein [Marinilabiliaceae bacterium]|jgi:small conductance mechanosensitive channel|nr:mechanosensitive ion channel domain-containing protein [Marinilabiliaceae bacterium]